MAAPALPTVRARVRLRIRLGAPSTAAPIAGFIESGGPIVPLAIVRGDSVAGNASWYRIAADRYVWAGFGEPPAPPTMVPQTMDVSYRSDVSGALTVLSDEDRAEVFGAIAPGDYTEIGRTGAIDLDRRWVAAYLVDIDTPIFAAIGHPRLTVHRLAAAAFRAVFAKIEAARLGAEIRHCDGTFVARHKGWDPDRNLSSHSWGIAIDLNARWNAYGGPPAPLGAIGCVRDLVGLFESEGFAWGGYFTPDRYRDGMHFELARRDPAA